MQEQANELIERLIKADEEELDYSKVAWTEKHKVITLKEQARVLTESLRTLKGSDLEEAIKASLEFLEMIKPVVSYIHRNG